MTLQARIIQLQQAGRLPQGGGHLADHVAARLREDPARAIIREGETTLTRAALYDMACRLGGALRAQGVAKGAVIAFQTPNWWEACVVNLAAALFGYRLVPILSIARRAELSHLFETLDIAALFLPATWRGHDYQAEARACAGAPRLLVPLRDGDAFARLLDHAPIAPDPSAAGDIKQVLFTSGSTGRPKGVLQSHAGMMALIGMAAEFWGITEDDRLYVPSPLGHIGGSIYAFEFPWVTGCTAILAERWDPQAAVTAFTDGGASFMAGATPFLTGLLEAAGGRDLPSLRRFICGGASVPPELVQRALAAWPRAVVSRAYGATEVPLVCPGVRDRAGAERAAATDGQVGADLVIRDTTGAPCAEGTEGEITVRAGHMLAGYLDPADEEGAFTPDGYFRMGDLGIAQDGFLTITGRQKDIIIRKGENISPLEIENALARHPALRQSAVVGCPDAERGEKVVAFVLPVAGASFDLAVMQAHLSSLGMARQKWPETLYQVAELPLNPVGKVEKPVLRQWARERAGGG